MGYRAKARPETRPENRTLSQVVLILWPCCFSVRTQSHIVGEPYPIGAWEAKSGRRVGSPESYTRLHLNLHVGLEAKPPPQRCRKAMPGNSAPRELHTTNTARRTLQCKFPFLGIRSYEWTSELRAPGRARGCSFR